MADRQLKIVVSADVHQAQQAMATLASSAQHFQSSLGQTNSAIGGFQQAANHAGSAAQGVGHSMTQAANATQQIGGTVQKAGNSFADFAKKAIAIVGVGAAIKSTIKQGADFQSSLNTLRAVSQSTNAQMQQVAATARQLGNDIEIPGASAATAADAMTELAKGGLSVKESMTAAKGTLQLAAAAQIDGAQAAEIQANAINTFGLAGKDAAHVGDVLANTANAASGEITDFAAALAQGGLVAHSMGMSIDDTSTALGIFANQGLLGSDAGTSLKSMLVQLQSPTKQQAAALKTLGVTAFDAQGNFVGMRTVTEELANAQKNLTQEQFTAAASTAFGTDAVRAATAVAAEGTAGWDKMAAAVSRSGGAAELAAAQMQGLHGAFALVQNAVQDAQIALMDQLSPALEDSTKQLANMIPTLADQLVPAIGVAGGALIGIAQSAMPLLVSAANVVAPAMAAVGSTFSTLVPLITPVVGLIGGAAELFGKLPGPVLVAGAALGGFLLLQRRFSGYITGINNAGGATNLFARKVQFLMSQGMSPFGAAARVTAAQVTGLVTQLRASVTAASAAGARFPIMAVGLRGVGTAAAFAGKGLLAMVGGPIGIAIIGVTTALSIFSSKSAEASQRTEEFNSRSKELADTLNKTTGALSDDTTAKIVEDFANVADEFAAVNVKSGDAAQAMIAYGKGTAGAREQVDAIRDAIFKQTNVLDNSSINNGSAAKNLDQFARDLGVASISYRDMQTAALGGNAAIDEQARRVEAAGGSYAGAVEAMQSYRGQAEGAVPSLRSLNAEQDVVTKGLELQATAMKTATDGALAAAGAWGGQFQQAMKNATTSGASLEEAMAALNIPAEQQSAIMSVLKGHLQEVGDKAHYLTPEAAAAAQALGITGDKAGGTAENLNRLKGSVPTSALQALHGDSQKAADGVGAVADAADDAEPAVGSFAKAMADAKEPAGGLKGALDEVKSAADNVSSASDLMAAAVLRAAGIDLSAEQAQRENAAALRGVTQGILERGRAQTDATRASQDLTRAEQDYNAVIKEGRKTEVKKDEDGKKHVVFAETEVEWTRRREDAARKLTDAQRAVQDATLKAAAAQTADREGYEKAAQSALEMANKAGLAALATGSVASASKRAQATITDQRKAFIDAATAAGMSEKAAAKLADQYGLTPKAVKTQFEALIANAEKNGTHLFQVYDKTTGQWTAQFLTKDDAAAKLKAGDVLKAYDKTRGEWTGKITADNHDALDKLDATEKAVAGIKDKEVKITYKGVIVSSPGSGTGGSVQKHAATGGYISGPGTGTSDSIPAMLSNGEYVVRASQTAKHRGLLERINAGVQGFASGGFMGHRGKEVGHYDIVGSSAGAPDLGAMLANAAQGMAKAAGAALQRLVPPMPPVTSGVAQWLPLAQRVFAAKGAPFSAIPIMMAQMQNESGGNPRAINLWDINAKRGTPSKGLLQFIDPTFRHYADPGYNTNIWDPESQMRAFINYVPARYGSFSYLTRIGNKAYAQGGQVSGAGSGTSDSIMARVSNGEFIVNSSATSRNLSLLHAINSGVAGFASGGLVGAPALAGIAPRSYGDREGVSRQALSDVLSFIKDLESTTRDLESTARQSAQSYREAKAAAVETAAQGRKDRTQARLDWNEKKAEAEANLRAAKTADQRITRQRALDRVNAEGQKAYNVALAAERKANAQAESKVAVARRQADADLNAARAAHSRSTAEDLVWTRQQRLRDSLVQTSRAYDQATSALSTARDRLSSAKASRDDLVSSLSGSIVGLGSGLTGYASERTSQAQIIAGLRYDSNRESQFGAALTKLKTLGLSSGSISDLISKGEDGYTTAITLAKTGTRAGVAQINSLLAQQVASANRIAQSTPQVQAMTANVAALSKVVIGWDARLAALEKTGLVNAKQLAAEVALASNAITTGRLAQVEKMVAITRGRS